MAMKKAVATQEKAMKCRHPKTEQYKFKKGSAFTNSWVLEDKVLAWCNVCGAIRVGSSCYRPTWWTADVTTKPEDEDC